MIPSPDGARAINAALDEMEAEIDALVQEADAFLARPKATWAPREFAALVRRHRDYVERLALLAVEPRGLA